MKTNLVENISKISSYTTTAKSYLHKNVTEEYASTSEDYTSASEEYENVAEKYRSTSEKYTITPEEYTSATEKYAIATEKYTSTTENYTISPEKYTIVTEKHEITPEKHTSTTKVYTNIPRVHTSTTKIYSSTPKIYTSTSEENYFTTIKTPSGQIQSTDVKIEESNQTNSSFDLETESTIFKTNVKTEKSSTFSNYEDLYNLPESTDITEEKQLENTSKKIKCDINKLPPPPINGYTLVDTIDSYNKEEGNIIKYTCRTGYEMQGNDRVECVQDGYWSDLNMTCPREKIVINLFTLLKIN